MRNNNDAMQCKQWLKCHRVISCDGIITPCTNTLTWETTNNDTKIHSMSLVAMTIMTTMGLGWNGLKIVSLEWSHSFLWFKSWNILVMSHSQIQIRVRDQLGWWDKNFFQKGQKLPFIWLDLTLGWTLVAQWIGFDMVLTMTGSSRIKKYSLTQPKPRHC